MICEIPALETLKALKFAKDLDELIVDEAFTFNANMKWVRPFGMLLTACSIKQFREKHIDIPFNFECYTTNKSISYASHMGFFKSISERLEIGKEPGEAMGNDNYIPITEINTNQILKDEVSKGRMIEMGDAIELKASELAKIVSRDNKEFHSLLTYLIREILRNIPEHADCNKAWICGQYWRDGTAEIAIVDEGIGVLNSLRRNVIHREYIRNDEEGLKYALKAGISQAFQPSKSNASNNPWANSGFGLYMVSEICKELQGSFCLASGEKYLNINCDGSTSIGNTAFKGTAVKITVSTNALQRSQDIINKIAKQGEGQARTIRNAFKKASMPSKGLIENL
ncbi:ATP-binding protein [Acetobacterium wieringae]|uniref:ATP-binding protein n=1 Tax=Acetobacterium wieringae TaxID=52694 RepID=UPI0020344E25|nr:ATP-binding protein [Acetobacterium wieringae]URN84963.1 hypothetical protein CHL1_000563 [Acetobacterium wieringae]